MKKLLLIVILVIGLVEVNVKAADYYSQGTDNFSTLTNWNTASDGSGTNPVAGDLTDGLNNFIIQTGHTITVDQDIDVASFDITGYLYIGNDATSRTVTSGPITVNGGGRFRSSTIDGIHNLYVDGNITNNGSFDLYINDSRLTNTVINSSITIDGSATLYFADLTITNSSTITHNRTLQTNGNFEVNSASQFNSVAYIYCYGNFTITGNSSFTTSNYVRVDYNFSVSTGNSFEQTGSRIEFYGITPQNIDLSGSVIFYQIRLNGGTISNPKNINGDFTVRNTFYVFSVAHINCSDSLSITGGLRLDGYANFTGILNFRNGTIYNNNNDTLSLGTADVYITNGTTTINDTVNIGGNLIVEDGATLRINADSYIQGTGTKDFTMSDGTGTTLDLRGEDNFPAGFLSYTLDENTRVIYQTTSDQIIKGGITYSGELELNTTGTKTVDGPIDVNGILDLNNGITLDLQNYDHTFANDIQNGSNASISATGGSVTLDGIDTDQTVQANGTGSYTFYNLVFTAPSLTATKTINIDGNVSVTNNFTASNSSAPAHELYIDIDANSITGGNNFTLGESCRILTSGETSFRDMLTSFSGTTSLDVTSTIVYDRGGTQYLAHQPTYGDLEIASNGTKYIEGALDIDGNFNITTNAGFTIDFADNNIDIAGDFNKLSTGGGLIYSGTTGITSIGGDINCTSGSISLSGDVNISGDIDITGNSILEIGYDGTSRIVSVSGNVSIENGSTLRTRNVDGIHNLEIGENLTINGTFDIYSNANRYINLTFINAGGDQSIQGTPTAIDIFNLSLGALSGVTSLEIDISDIRDNITIENGATLDLNSYTLAPSGDITINNGGTLEVDENASLQMADTKSITNAGTFKVVGTSGNEATVTNNGSGTYSISQTDAAATFHARYYNFLNLGTDGITISNGNIDATNNFSNGVFNNSAGNQYLNLTDITFSGTISSVEFNSGPTYNVSRTSGTGAVIFSEATGNLAGEIYDNDNGNPGSLILWIYPSKTYYSQSDGNFSNTANWDRNELGGGGNPAAGDLTSGECTFIVQDGHTVTVDQNLTLLGLEVGEGTSGILTFDDATSDTVIVNEYFDVNANGTVNVGATVGTHLLFLKGNLTNNGTINFRPASNRLVNTYFYGTSCQVIGSNAPIFNNLVLTDSGSVTLTSSNSLDINGSLTIENGATFIDGGQTHTIAGNWTQNGSGTYTANGTIEFDGILNIIQSAATFNNVVFKGGSTAIATATTYFDGNLTINNATTLSTSQNIYVRGNFLVDVGSGYSQSANTTYFDGSSSQSIDVSNATFYNMNFDNGGALNPKTITGDINSTANFIVTDDASITGAGDHVFGNNFQMDGICNFSGSLTFTGGNIYDNTDNTIELGTADVIIDGGTVNINSNDEVIVNGNFTIENGTFNIYNGCFLTGSGANNFEITGTSGTPTIQLLGADNFPTNFSAYSFTSNSRILYGMNGDQTVRGGMTIGELELGGGGTKTADGALDINGDLDLNNGVSFDLGNYVHTIEGNIYNATASELTSTGDVTLDAPDANQTIQDGTYTFYNLYFTNTAPSDNRSKYIQADLTVNNDFSFTNSGGESSKLLYCELYDHVITGGNDFTLGSFCELRTNGTNSFKTSVNSFSGTISLDQESTINYNLNGAQTIADFTNDGVTYGNLYFGNTGDKTALGSLDIDGTFDRTGGTPIFVDGGFVHYISSHWLLDPAYYTNPTGTITLDGADQNVSASNFYNIVFAGSGTKTLVGNITVANDLTINNSINVSAGQYDITIQGDWIDNGTFSQDDDGITTFNSTTANQQITSGGSSAFGDLVIDKSVIGNQTVQLLSDIDVNDDLTFTLSAAELDATNQTIYLGGNWNCYFGTSFISTGSTVRFDGATDQNIRTDGDPTFNDVIFEGAGEKRIYDNYGTDGIVYALDVDGDFTNNSSIDAYQYAGGVDIEIAGTFTNNGSLLHNGQTLYFDGADQLIGPSSFWHVNFAGTGTKTLGGSISTGGNLTISDGVTLDVSTNHYSISIGESWDNSGTGIFVPQNGTVTTVGNGGSSINTGGTGAGKTFWNLTCNHANASNVTLADDLKVTNNFTITTGNLVTSTFSVYLLGNFNNTGGYFNQNNNASILNFNATSGTKTIDPGANHNFQQIIIDATDVIYELANDLTSSNGDELTLTNGTFDVNGNTLTLTNGDVRISSGATLEVDAGASLLIGDNDSLINEGGIFKLVGEEGNPAILGLYGAGGFRAYQSSGTFHAKYYRIEGTETEGVHIIGGSIDGTNNFSQGTFTGGTGNQYLYIQNIDFGVASVEDTAKNVRFNSGPTNNVQRDASGGDLVFEDATGLIAGEYYDNDPNDNIDWTFPTGFEWDGSEGDEDWANALNWDGNTVPSDGNIVYLNHQQNAAEYTVRIKNEDVKIGRLFLDTEGGNALHLVVQDGYELWVEEDLNIGANTSLSLNANTDTLKVGTHWTNAGTFNHGNSTVVFNGTSGIWDIDAGGTGAGKEFFNLYINSADDPIYSLSSDIKVEGDLIITQGTLDVTSADYDIYISGDWTSGGDGIFEYQQGNVIFENAGDQTISGNGFYDFTTSGASGTKQFATNISVYNDIIIGTGTTLDAQTFNINCGGDWTNNGTFSQSGSGEVNFNSTGTRYIDNGTSSTTFNNIVFANGGQKNFSGNSSANGNVTISSGSGRVNLDTYTLTGIGGSNSFTIIDNSYLRLTGASNFPTGFETVSLSSNSIVEYYSDSDQDIYIASYGSIYLGDNGGNSNTTKSLSDNVTIAGTLNITDIYAELDVNGHTITLTGNLAFPAGGRDIVWDSGTLIHNGAAWNIDADISEFHNLTLSGSNYKNLTSNLTITGNVSVQSGVYLNMQSYTMTGSGGIFTLDDGSRLYSAVPDATGVAFPTAFGTFNIAVTSSVYLNSANGVDQELYTGITYGNLTFNNTKTVTSDGNNDLDVDGDLNFGNCTYDENLQDLFLAGSNLYINSYSPASTITITLNGSDQYIRDNVSTALNVGTIVFAGSGTKTFGDGNDAITVSGNLTINNGVTVNCARNLEFTGSTFTNNGTYNHTANALTFNSGSAISIDPGTNNAFYNLAFSGAGTKTFANDADINGTFTINAGTVDLGSNSYAIAETVTNTAGGTLSSSNADITFDGDASDINTPNFQVNNVTIAGTGWKRMFSDWTINGDLTIESGAYLSSSDNVIPTYYDIYIKGNWVNNGGTFQDNTAKVIFNGSSSPINITSDGQNFYDIEFAPSSSVTYNLQSTSTRIAREMVVGANATFNLNSKELILGSNLGSGKTYTVTGTLNVNENSVLKFNNQGSVCTMNVSGTLMVVGTDALNVATITYETTRGAEINITTGTIEARYYLIEFISDNGLNVSSSASVDATNNFSDGTWSNMSTAGGSPKYYLVHNADRPSADNIVNNIVFNFSGTPTVGVHYNVKRENTANDTLKFEETVSGNLGGVTYEDDGDLVNSSKITWPPSSSVVWNGSLSDDWNTAGNWTPANIPTSVTDVTIPNAGTPPSINTADAQCKNLSITDGFLTLDGYDLTVDGNLVIGDGSVSSLLVANSSSEITVGGFWTKNNNAIFTHGNGKVTFNSSTGSVTISPGTSNFYDVYIDNATTVFSLAFPATRTISIDGDLVVNAGTLEPSTDNYILNISGDIDFDNGTFDPNPGSIDGDVNLVGLADQTIRSGIFNDLSVSGSGTKTFVGTTTINDELIVSSSMAATLGTNIDMKGNVTIEATGTFADGDETHTFTGQTWTGEGSYSGTGTITFDRNGTQYLNGGEFNNLILDGDGGNDARYLQNDIVVKSDMTINVNSGQLYLSTYSITNSSGTGTFTLEANKYMHIAGANNFAPTFASYNFETGSRVYFDGALDQTIPGLTYSNLYLDDNVKTLSGNISVDGTLVFNDAELDVSANHYAINISGNWNNNNGGSFTARQGTVTFDGSGNQIIYINNALTDNDFYNITIDNSSGSVYPNADLTINNNLVVTTGTFSTNNYEITVSGDFTATGGTFATNGTYILNKASGSANIQFNGSTINNLTINSATGATYTAVDDIILNGNFTLTAGTFDGNGNSVTLGNGGTDVASISDNYIVGAGGSLILGDDVALTVAATGSIEVVGNASNISTVTHRANDRFTFNVEGEIKAKYALFEYMNANGIYIKSTATIDPLSAGDNFSFCTFTNGMNGGAMLKIENNQSFTGTDSIVDVSFPTDPGGTSYNVHKANATGNIEFYNASGVFAGEDFDLDNNNLVDWTGPISLTWDGSHGTDWYSADNWTASSGPNIVPTGDEDVTIPTGLTNYPILTSGGALTKNLVIESGAKVWLQTIADPDLDLEINGDIEINGEFKLYSINDSVSVSGNYTNQGTVVLNGTVILASNGTPKIVNNDVASFSYLVIDGTSTVQAANNITVTKDFVIENGTFDLLNRTLTVGGDWINNGTFATGTNGKLTLNASSGPRIFNPGSSNQNFFDINASGVTYALTTNNLTANRNVNIIAGTLDINGLIFNMGDNSGTDNLSITGTLIVDENASLKLATNASVTVNSGGTVYVVGTDDSNLASVTNQGINYYAFVVNSGGTIHAKYYTFDYTNENGVYVKSGATINATNNFSNGTFSNGKSAGTYLKFEHNYPSADDTIRNIVFNAGPSYSITRTSGSGNTVLKDAEGILASYSYEYDDEFPASSPTSGLIQWSYTDPRVTWTGSGGTAWNNIANWIPGNVPDLTYNVVIPGGLANYPLINAATGDALAKSITINPNGLLTISENTNLTVAEAINISGTLTVSSGSASNITTGDEWINVGTFNSGNSTIILNGATGTLNFTPGSDTYYNIQVNSSGDATYQLNANIDIDNDLTISVGTFDVSSGVYQVNIGGNYTNNATLTCGTSTFVFDKASGTQIIDAGGTGVPKAFYNITKTNNGTLQLTDDIEILNNVVVSGGIVDANSNVITLGGNWTSSYTLSNASLIFNGTANDQEFKNNYVTFNSITVNKGSGSNIVQFKNSFTVSSDITLTTGKVSMGAYILTLGNNANMTGGSSNSYIFADYSNSYIKKNFADGDAELMGLPVINFAIGDADDFSPFTFLIENGDLSSANITMKLFDTQHPQQNGPGGWLTPDYISRYWTLTPTGISGSDIDYSVTMIYTDGDVVGDESVIHTAKYNSGTGWSSIGSSLANTGTNTLVWNNITSFSDFTGGGGAPLPISLISFEGAVKNGEVHLFWATAAELNNDYFTIERSKDGIEFEELERIKGFGNSSTIQYYNYIDNNPHKETSYYRLKQTDFDGNYNYSNWISIYNNINLTIQNVTFYPNPVSREDDFYLKIQDLVINENIDYKIVDYSGKIISTNKIKTNGDNNSIHRIDISMIEESGLYWIVLTLKNENLVKKFVIK